MTTATEQRTCGRPTSSGRPCRNPIHGYTQACWQHATDQDRAVADRLRQVHEDGVEWGRKLGRQEAKHEQAQAKRDAEAAAERAANWRTHTPDGRQLVTIGRYTYAWAGDQPLAVGDQVRVPAASDGWGDVFPARDAEVTGLGSDYQGDLVTLVRRAVG